MTKVKQQIGVLRFRPLYTDKVNDQVMAIYAKVVKYTYWMWKNLTDEIKEDAWRR